MKKIITPEILAEKLNPPNRMSFEKIGKEYGVTRQRIHQIYKEYKSNHPDIFYEKKELNKKEIQKMLDNQKTLKEVASFYDVSITKVSFFIKKNGIKKTFLKDKITKEMLKNYVYKKNLSDEDIAKIFNCSKNTISKLRYDYNILRK